MSDLFAISSLHLLLGERGSYCAAGPECRGGGPPPALWRGDLRQAHLHRLPQRQHPRRHQELQEARANVQVSSMCISLSLYLFLCLCLCLFPLFTVFLNGNILGVIKNYKKLVRTFRCCPSLSLYLSLSSFHCLPQRQHPRRHQGLQEAGADLPRLSLSVSLCRSLSLSVCPLEPQQLGMGGRNKVSRQDPCSFFL